MATNDWNDAERRVERAQELFEQRKWLEALDELRHATSINPYNASWFFNIGLTLDELNRNDEAIGAYEQALAIDPQDVQALYHLGLDLHQVGNFAKALQCFEQIEQFEPTFEPGYCARIITYCEMGQHDKAEEMFYLARLFKEHCDECFFNIGVSLMARQMFDRAIYCFSRTLERDDNWPEAHFRLAKAMHCKGELEQARRHCAIGLRQQPGNIEALLDLSDLLIDMKRIGEAGEKIRRAIELAPEEPASHCCHGRLLMRQGKDAEAKAAFEKALQLDPTCSSAHLELGSIAFEAGELEDARKHLRSELLLNPENPALLHQLGHRLLDANELRSAAACFKRLTQSRPNDVSAWLNLGVAHFLRERYEDGIACCKRALRIDPRSLAAHYNLALAYERLGDFNRAVVQVRNGLRHFPRDQALQRLEFRLVVLRLRKRVLRKLTRAISLAIPRRYSNRD